MIKSKISTAAVDLAVASNLRNRLGAPTAKLRMRAVDWAALLIFGYEVPSLLYSRYRANSVRTSEAIAIAVLAYFVTRLMIGKPVQAAGVAGFFGIGGAWLAFSEIRQFVISTVPLVEAGLTDFVAFRSRLVHPIPGWVPGESFTVLLLSLSFACAGAAYLWRKGFLKGKSGQAAFALLPALLIAVALSLSLSRAVFWSAILSFSTTCGLMVAYRVISLRTGALLLAGVLGTLVLILACDSALYSGIFTAYLGSHTSQVRSTQGRFGIWSRSLELVRVHPLWGVGSSNTALFLASSADQEETTGFASRAFSLPIQVLVEKGIVGFTLYAAFLLLVAREFHRAVRSTPLTEVRPNSQIRSRNPSSARSHEEQLRLQNETARKAMNCCFAAGLVAVLFRELTYSSLLEHTLTVVLALTLAALTCAHDSA